jgi:M61 glycyl aminopeptidase
MVMSRFLRRLALAALLVPTLRTHAQDAPHYELHFEAQTQMLSVRLCLAKAHAIVEFAADSETAMHYLHDLQRSGGDGVEAGSAAWSSGHWRAGECLNYSADLGAIANANEQDVGWRLGDDLVSAPQLWLLRPDVQGDADAEVTVFLPPGWNISAPWHELKRTEESVVFRIPNTPANWSVAVAFGHFDEERIELPGGVLRLSILHGASAEEKKKLHDWLARVSRAVLSAYGRLPLPDVQVLMIPVGQLGLASRAVAAFAPRAVHFGQSIRGQGNALELLVDPSRPAAEFDDDWIAVHELSHLMHPYLGDRGSWVAEGLATYYQNILRARSGLLTPTQAWDRLQEGFSRGAANKGDGEPVGGGEYASQPHISAHLLEWRRLLAHRRPRSASRQRPQAQHGTGPVALPRLLPAVIPAMAAAGFRCKTRRPAWRQNVFATLSGIRRDAGISRLEKLYAELGIRTGGEHLAFVADAVDAAAREQITAPRKDTDDTPAR